jgi:hypothetical protein
MDTALMPDLKPGESPFGLRALSSEEAQRLLAEGLPADTQQCDRSSSSVLFLAVSPRK